MEVTFKKPKKDGRNYMEVVDFSVQVRLPRGQGGLFLAVLPVTKQHTIFLYIVFIFCLLGIKAFDKGNQEWKIDISI